MAVPTRAVLIPQQGSECPLHEVMQASGEELCRRAWPLIPAEEQSRQLTEVYFPPPMRISASPKASEQTFFDRINESASCLVHQVDEHHFAEETATAHRLRSALFEHALQGLRRDVYNLTIAPCSPTVPGSSQSPPRKREAGNAEGDSVVASPLSAPNTETIAAQKGERARRAKERASLSSTGPAVTDDKIDINDDGGAAPPSGSAGASKVSRDRKLAAAAAFCDVLKPHALVTHVLDHDREWSVVEHDVAQLLTTAVSAIVLDASRQEAPAMEAPPDGTTPQDMLVHTAAQLCLRASFAPRAGRAFVALLRALLDREKDLSASVTATSPRQSLVAPLAGSGTRPFSPSNETEKGAAAAERTVRPADIHQSFVWSLLVPVLHLVPLGEWGTQDLQALAECLASAHAPRPRGTTLDHDRHMTTTAFSTKTTVSLRALDGRPSAAARPRPPPPAASTSATAAAGGEEANAGGADVPRLGGANGDEWVWGDTAPVSSATDAVETSGAQGTGDGVPRSALTDVDGDAAREEEEHGQVPRTPQEGSADDDDDDTARSSSAFSGVDISREMSDTHLDASLHISQPPVPRTRRDTNAGADSHGSASGDRGRGTAQDVWQDCVSIFEAPHARRVCVRVHDAVGCGHVRVIVLPLHPSHEEGDVLPVCREPRTGDSYVWDGPCEVQVVCMNRPLPESTGSPSGGDGGAAPRRAGTGTAAGQPVPRLDADIVVELSVALDTRWQLEWSLSLLHAQRYLAEELLADLQDAVSTALTAAHAGGSNAFPSSVVGSRALAPSSLGGPLRGGGDEPAGLELPPALFGRGLRTPLCAAPSVSSPTVAPPPQQQSQPSEHAFVDSVRALPDKELRLRTRCRSSDLPGVRAVLVVIAHLFTSTRSRVQWTWRTPDWLDAVRRVSLSSASLDRRVHVAELAAFIVQNVEGDCSPPAAHALSPSALSAGPSQAQVVDAVISFFSRGDALLTVAELQQELHARAALARRAVGMLRLLEDACEHSPSPKNLTLVARALKSFLMLQDGTHYLSAFTGCGLALESAMRGHVHQVMTRLYALLRGVVAKADKVQRSPQRFLFEPWAYGAFATLTVSLLVSQLDMADVAFVTRGIASQITAMLPDFTNLARTESFLVGEGEEVNFIKAFSEYFCETDVEGTDGAAVAPPLAGLGAGAAASTAAASAATTGASSFSPGLAAQARPDGGTVGEVSMSGARQDAPHAFSSLPASVFAHSKEPVFSHEWTFGVGPKSFGVHLLNDSLSNFYIGLATPALLTTRPDISRDPAGMYLLAEGRLHHGGEQAAVPPLRSGDDVNFVFGFEAGRWRVAFVLNGYLLASFVAPTQPLSLVLGYTDNADHGARYRGACGRPLFMPPPQQQQEQASQERGETDLAAARRRASVALQSTRASAFSLRDGSRQRQRQRRRSRQPVSSPASSGGGGDGGGAHPANTFTNAFPSFPLSQPHDAFLAAQHRRGGGGGDGDASVWFTAAPADLRRLRLLCRGPHMKPTFYNTSLFTALVFHYLVVSCAKKQRQQHHQRTAASSGGVTPLTHDAEDTLRRFVDGCGVPLRRNVHLLVRSLASMAPAAASMGAVPCPRSPPSSGGAAGPQDGHGSDAASGSRHASLARERGGGGDSTERVKRRTAALVYNNLLLDYTISLAVTLRVTSSLVDGMNTLTDVVCCRQAAAKTRSVALSAAYNAIALQSTALAEDGVSGAAGASSSSGVQGDGFGLLAFNPQRLWDCCKELAGDWKATTALRPTFGSATVPAEIAVKSGGRSIVYKPCGPQRSGQRTVSYATTGIPLDGSLGDVVSFSARLQRGFQTNSLGRFYHVGVACCTRGDAATRELTSHPGDRQRQHMCYSVTDFFLDAAEPRVELRNEAPETRVELKRHEANWLSPDDGIVFGSGDVITVTVHCKLRCIRFERNGRPLGTLYRKLPDSVKVLFPFVELYNRDSMAKWMYSPNELLVHGRYTMRAMLRYWTPELMPKLQDMLAAAQVSGDCTPLQILGADGDELSHVYRAPPRSDVQATVLNVRLVRTEGRFAVVEDEGGATHRVVAAALEPNHAAPMSMGDAMNSLLVPDMLRAVLTEIVVEQETAHGELHSSVRIQHPALLVRLLRLLSEAEDGTRKGGRCEDPSDAAAAVAEEPGELLGDGSGAEGGAFLVHAQNAFAETDTVLLRAQKAAVERLLELLKVQTLDLSGEVLLREAWNEICWAPDAGGTHRGPLRLDLDERRTLVLPPLPTSPGGTPTASVKSCISLSSVPSLYVREDGTFELLCPTCGEPWSECVARHEAPPNTCALCDAILRCNGLPSPYTGWCATWSSAVKPTPTSGLDGAAAATLPSSGEGMRAAAGGHEPAFSPAGASLPPPSPASAAVAEEVATTPASSARYSAFDGAGSGGESGSEEADTRQSHRGADPRATASGVRDDDRGAHDGGAFDADYRYGSDYLLGDDDEDEEEEEEEEVEQAADSGATGGHVGHAGGVGAAVAAAAAASEAGGDVKDTPLHPITITFEPVELTTTASCSTATTASSAASTGETVHLRGRGETANGAFTFEGQLISPTAMKGRIAFLQGEPAEEGGGGGGDADEEWSCVACTFRNTPDTTRCAICATARPGAMWVCPVCNYAYNPNRANMCATCGQLRSGAMRSLLGLRGSDRACYCESCHSKREFRTFKNLSLYQTCDECQRETRWLPKDKFAGMMEARIVEEGDKLEFTWHVDGATESVHGLATSNYSAPQLQRMVRERVPEGANQLSRYVPPLSQHSALEETALQRKEPSGIQACLPSAIVYYASRLVLLWGPATNPNIFTDAEVLTRLLVFAESWLEPLRSVSQEAATNILHTCLSMLFAGVESPHVVQTISSAARVLMKANPCLSHQCHYLLYALCVTASRYHARRTREVCYSCIAKLFEDYPSDYINAQCLSSVVRQQPIVAGQQRVIVHAVLRHVPVGDVSTASTKAASCLARTITCMETGEAMPHLLDSNMSDAFPYVVALAETRINEGGQLQVGQIRGSVGYAPTKGGRFYYEIVLPQNYSETSSVIVMGWGTLQHEHLSSSQHVGSDLHSWGFNCRDRLRLMMGEQIVAVPQRPAPGDVIGSMMDLETMMVCWSVNGEPLMWVSVPAQGASEEIYPFVSAAVEPCGVEVRLGHTQFTPEGYQDYSPPSDTQVWAVSSDAAPAQSYTFYRELCTLLDEVSVTDLRVKSSVLHSLDSSRAQRALARYPTVLAYVQSTAARATGREDAEGRVAREGAEGAAVTAATAATGMACLGPYIQHLSAISDLTIMLARNYPMIKESSFLTECYRKAKDLLLSSARWVIFETQIGGRPTFNTSHSRSVRIDLHKARNATEIDSGTPRGCGAAPASASAPAAAASAVLPGSIGERGRGEEAGGVAAANTTASPGPTAVALPASPKAARMALTQSVTGQLFHQIENAPIYKNAIMFTVKLADDVTNDAGGVTRSVLSTIAEELNYQVRHGTRVDPAVPLFKLCGHTTMFTVVPNMERLLSEAGAFAEEEEAAGDERLCHRMLTWLGMVMGNITLCGTTKLPLNFPRIAWKYFTFAKATIEDYYYDVDDTVRGSLADDDFLLNDEYFYSIPGILALQHPQQTDGVGDGHAAALRLPRSTSAAVLATASPIGGDRAAAAAQHTLVVRGSAGGGAAPGRALSRPLRPYSCMTPAVSVMDLTAHHMSRAVSRVNLSAALADLDDAGDEEALAAATEAAARAHRNREAHRRRQMAEQALLHQYDAALQCMRNGLVSVLSQGSLRSIRWDDLQSRICGAPNITAEHVMAYLDWATVGEELKAMLSQVLVDMTERERGQFLLFCSGQSRLPLPEKISVTCGDDPALIPTAHTCSPVSLRLQPYRSAEEMRQRLDLCLANAKQFGFV